MKTSVSHFASIAMRANSFVRGRGRDTFLLFPMFTVFVSLFSFFLNLFQTGKLLIVESALVLIDLPFLFSHHRKLNLNN